MKTKALVLAAVISAAGVASSLAQVYSVNAVGYVNQTVPTGYSMAANPFVTPSNTLNALLPPAQLPEFFTLFKFGASGSPNPGYTVCTVDSIDGWLSNGQLVGDTETIIFGDGVFLLNPGAPLTVTWVGEVAQGNPVQNPLVTGYQIKSSKIPQAGKVTTDLQYPPTLFDTLFQFDSSPPPAGQKYRVYTYDDVDGWLQNGLPDEPTIGIAESFFILRPGGNLSWNRNFSVN